MFVAVSYSWNVSPMRVADHCGGGLLGQGSEV
jgi:hypothetical protein